MPQQTKILLSLWDPGLVEEALSFVEEYKLLANTDDSGVGDDCSLEAHASLVLSPFKRITQQLTSLDLKSPDLDDFATPCTPRNIEDMWKLHNGTSTSTSASEHDFRSLQDNRMSSRTHTPGEETSSHHNIPSFSILNTSDGVRSLCSRVPTPDETQFVIFPDVEDRDHDFDLPNHEEDCAMMNNIDYNKENRNHQNVEEIILQEIDMGKMFLDTQAMCNSPSANYYKPTDEPEPWDLTQLNIEASVMCLVSKVKFLCGRCGSPAVRLRSNQRAKKVITSQPTTKIDRKSSQLIEDPNENQETVLKVVDSVNKLVRNGNKFTDGLDINKINDWAAELRPSMRKLRQAMDGLLKTARLTHSVFRVQEDPRAAQRVCNVRYRRDVCFSQALTSLATALMIRLWCHKPDPIFLMGLTILGPLACFEGLLSYHGDEIDMWGDMSVAVEDLRTVMFTLTRCPIPTSGDLQPSPKVTGCRNALTVFLPVPDAVYSLLPSRQNVSFHVTPVFFNIGINEMASLAESLNATRPQERSNVDNFERLNEYYLRYRKLNLPVPPMANNRISVCSPQYKPLSELVENLRASVHSSRNKNVEVLHVAGQICRQMKGLAWFITRQKTLIYLILFQV